jgi:GxxExxY protein
MRTLDTDSGDLQESHGDNGRGENHLLHHQITRVIIGAFYSVHSQLGAGFFETVYANALAVVLRRASVRVEREMPFDVIFLGENIGRYRADLVVDGQVIVEVKCGRAIDGAHVAQVRNYLRASGLQVGLVLNFGQNAEFRRVVV